MDQQLIIFLGTTRSYQSCFVFLHQIIRLSFYYKHSSTPNFICVFCLIFYYGIIFLQSSASLEFNASFIVWGHLIIEFKTSTNGETPRLDLKLYFYVLCEFDLPRLFPPNLAPPSDNSPSTDEFSRLAVLNESSFSLSRSIFMSAIIGFIRKTHKKFII